VVYGTEPQPPQRRWAPQRWRLTAGRRGDEGQGEAVCRPRQDAVDGRGGLVGAVAAAELLDGLVRRPRQLQRDVAPPPPVARAPVRLQADARAPRLGSAPKTYCVWSADHITTVSVWSADHNSTSQILSATSSTHATHANTRCSSQTASYDVASNIRWPLPRRR